MKRRDEDLNMDSVTQQVSKIKRGEQATFAEVLRSAHLAGHAVKISIFVKGRKYQYPISYPAHTITRIVDEPRRGMVCVMDDLSRVKVKEVTAVTVVQAERAIADMPDASIGSGPYYTERGQHFGTLRPVPPEERL